MSSCCSDLQDFGCGGSPKCPCFFPFVFIFFLGGYLLYAWEYMANHGLASEDCIPYASGSGHPPTCPSTCADNRTITRTAALLSSVAYSGSATQLQNEILTNGPIQVFMPMNAFAACCLLLCCFLFDICFQVGFDVYNDFFRFDWFSPHAVHFVTHFLSWKHFFHVSIDWWFFLRFLSLQSSCSSVILLTIFCHLQLRQRCLCSIPCRRLRWRSQRQNHRLGYRRNVEVALLDCSKQLGINLGNARFFPNFTRQWHMWHWKKFHLGFTKIVNSHIKRTSAYPSYIKPNHCASECSQNAAPTAPPSHVVINNRTWQDSVTNRSSNDE